LVKKKTVAKKIPAKKKEKKAIVMKKEVTKKSEKTKIKNDKEMDKEAVVMKPQVKEIGIESMKRIATILADAQVRQRLIDLGGENAIAIVRNFRENYSDEEISKKLEIKISDVRATLNKLHNEGLVNYLREKNNETGWYSYSWAINVGRIERWASTALSNSALNSGAGEYYFCSDCGISSIINFESAMDLSFKCERCERSLEHIDQNTISELYQKKKRMKN
jgi:transcription factor E